MSPMYQQQPDLIAADMDGETVMMSVKTGKYFALRGIAQFIWDFIAKPASIEQIVAAVEERYEVDRSQAFTDCQTFLDDLAAKDLVSKT